MNNPSQPEMSRIDKPIVRARNLTKRFPKAKKAALEGLDADIFPGRITGLAGPDGAGKTTFLRMVAGLLDLTEGELTVLGVDPATKAEEIHIRTGYMPQRFGLYEDLSVQQNMDLYADLRGVQGQQRQETFERLLGFTDLKRFTDRKAGALSGGMKQKLGLACALISKPELLLLDEPGVGVDPISRRELWKMVQALVAEGIGVIWSTAYLDEAEMCESVIVLNEGKSIFSGAPGELTDRVGDRTFILPVTQDKRQALQRALEVDSVVDGVVQGNHLRLVLRKGAKDFDAAAIGLEGKLRQVKPRFEDAFIDALGGPRRGKSRIAEALRQIPHDGDAVIEAHDLTKKFGDFAATDRVTFAVKRGELFGLLGPNGAGKSTTFKMMCGLLKPTSGTARVTGLDLQHSGSKARSRLGYMAQKFSLYADLTVRQNLDFFSGIYGLKNGQKKAVDSMLEIFAFGDQADVPSGQLPLGFKQRLSMAAALMHEPDVLFLDEPTSGVDPITRREFWKHINGLVEKGVTVMVTTHFMDEAEYCDRIGLVYRGQLIALGPPDELKRNVKTPELENPTMEDAFIALIREFDQENGGKA
ncbi:MAG TPA: ATP-binding cassette domain-containing protein [Chthoniobacterales bacterium]